MYLTSLAKHIYEANKAKGFWDEGVNRNIGELYALIISEGAEALEAHRKGKSANIAAYQEAMGDIVSDDYFKKSFEAYIKDSFQDEIADVVIRILDYAGFLGESINVQARHIHIEVVPTIGEELMLLYRILCDAYTLRAPYNIVNCLIEAIELCFDIANSYKFDLLYHIELKLRYNTLRPHKHGKSY